MRTTRRTGQSRNGSALFTVIMIILGISAVLGIGIGASMQRVFTAKKLTNRVRALSIAEAGAHQAYSLLATNFASRTDTNEFPVTLYGGGQYDVTCTPVSNDLAIIESVGVYRDATESVILDVKDFGVGTPGYSPTDIPDYAILCNGEFNFGGSGDIAGTNGMSKIHANSTINIKGDAGVNIGLESSSKIKIGNNNTIQGDVTAPTLDYNPSKVTITGTASTASVPLVPVPDIDLTPWFNWASDHGEVYNGLNISGGTINPDGGVIWVNGDAQISGGATVINGAIIATGEIHFGGGADLNPPADAGGMALVARDGRIKLTTSGTISSGLIYTKTSDLEHSANGSIHGQIIVSGNITKTGNSDVLVYEQTHPTPPGWDGTDEQIIGVTAWQK